MVTPISQEYLEVSWGQREFSDLVQALLVDWLKAALGVVPVKVVSPMGAFQVNKGLWVDRMKALRASGATYPDPPPEPAPIAADRGAPV